MNGGKFSGVNIGLACLASLLWIGSGCSHGAANGAEHWPQFRGPEGQGHAPEAKGLPLEWGPTKNVRWKTPIPGRGWSSPVVWERQVWLTTAAEEGHSLRAICVDRESGEVVHNVELFHIDAPPPINDKNSYASPTPALEAGRAYVSFGTFGTACLDTQTGEVLWRHQLLTLDHKEGPGSSPVLWQDKLLIHCDGMDVQFVAALDKQTGEIAWKHERQGIRATNPDFRKAYCTPLVVKVGDQWQMIGPGADRVTAYDPETGREIWAVDYEGFSNVPRPVAGHGLAFVCTGYMQPQLYAIRLGAGDASEAAGNRTESHVKWKAQKQIPANPSPLLIGQSLFLVSDGGVATCFDALTGKQHWQERIGGAFSASPIYADGRIYLFSEEGDGVVLDAADAYRELARNDMGERILASPAALGAALFVRTESHLYRIELEKSEK